MPLSPDIAKLPTFGVGLSFRGQFLHEMNAHSSTIGCLEIIAENYFPANAKSQLSKLKQYLPILPHGIKMSLGTLSGLDDDHLMAVKALCDYVDAPWFSEHIAFTHTQDTQIGHLTPMPFNEAAIQLLVRNINYAKSIVGRPFVLENIAYLISVPGSKLPEAEFISQVVEQTDSFLLLDITNLFANCLNHEMDLADFLEKIPLERVVQLHYCGGRWSGKYYLDSHNNKTPNQIWEIMDYILQRAPVRAVILERDDNVQLTDLVGELSKAKEIWNKYRHQH